MKSLAIRSVFHPSDFTVGDHAAFGHALRIALSAKAELSVLHVEESSDSVDWSDFPSIRETLAQWNLLPPNATKQQIHELGLRVEKVKRVGDRPSDEIQDFVADKEPDLVVLATHQRSGFSRWLHHAVAEPIARTPHARTLFVPRQVLGFVRSDSGRITLRNILVPVDQAPSPSLAIEAATLLARTLQVASAHFIFLHVGAEEDMPDIRFPSEAEWTHEIRAWSGPVVDHIVNTSEVSDVDLIVMAKRGHRGFLDALRGSITERVVRGAKCPVLIVSERA